MKLDFHGQLDIVKKWGLDKIKPGNYSLVKLREKKPNLYGIPPEGKVISAAAPSVVTDYEWAWLVLDTLNGRWYKTSPVIDVKEIETGYDIETWNSFYRLERE